MTLGTQPLHRQYDAALTGTLRYDPVRMRLARPWTACIDLPEAFAAQARERFRLRHGIVLEPPEFGFHMTVFNGPSDEREGPGISGLWGYLDGEKVTVQLTSELFWKGRCVWANAHCEEYFLLRDTLGGLDSSDAEMQGHATIGCFPPGTELPRFLDYRDLDAWGSRP